MVLSTLCTVHHALSFSYYHIIDIIIMFWFIILLYIWICIVIRTYYNNNNIMCISAIETCCTRHGERGLYTAIPAHQNSAIVNSGIQHRATWCHRHDDNNIIFIYYDTVQEFVPRARWPAKQHGPWGSRGTSDAPTRTHDNVTPLPYQLPPILFAGADTQTSSINNVLQ